MPSSEREEPRGLPPHPVIPEYYGSPREHQGWVGQMFDAVAPHYDRITEVMSLGTGSWYRGWALHRHGLRPGHRLIDVGTGTGVIARSAQDQVGSDGEAVALDPSTAMLEQARIRGVGHAIAARAEALPFPGERFDMLTMGYALRHVSDLETTFREYARCLAPEGRLLLLEVTPPRSRLGHTALGFYLGRVVPLLARLVTRSSDARVLMHYYWETIANCVPPETIERALMAAGFEQVGRRVVFGIFSEYSGQKPADS